MIIAKIHAGLGNQMFQYATGLRLAHFRKTPLKLDVTSFDDMVERDTPRSFDLDQYKISAPVATADELARILPVDWQPNFSHKIRRRLKLDQRLRVLGEHSKTFYSVVLRARDNTYLVGWWQNEQYFKDIRPILLKEFVPKKLSAYTKKLLVEIKNGDGISLHVRRGDYVTNKFAKEEHGLVSLAYYQAAIEHINKKVKEPQVFVFSDDIAWCQKHLRLGLPTVFIEGKGQQVSEDIYLNQHCQHNIVANSSFSWWGAWLNENPDKIIIAPKRWFQNEESDKETDIVPESWIRL